MTSLEVIDTDAFLDMPISSQLLYFHLNARADDDGFVANPKKVARILGAGPDDLKVLIAKKFIIVFEDGICVIKHWRINNFIRKDIYKETKYLDHKNTLFIRANGAYTQTDDGRAVALPSGHFQLDVVNGALTERQPRLGKVRKGKDNTGTKAQKSFNPLGAEILKAFEAIDPKNKTYYANKTQRSACDFLLAEYGLEKTKSAIAILPQINQRKLYIRQITTPYELKENWVKIGNALRQSKEIKNQVAF